ncbi:hypothetical protein GCM10010279_24400 [Streptomyces mutabilis]|nr:hypothetical protein GCM10010279_24400 [Streptomyces mutabilis]
MAGHKRTHKILTDAEPDGIRGEPERPNKETERLSGKRPP